MPAILVRKGGAEESLTRHKLFLSIVACISKAWLVAQQKVRSANGAACTSSECRNLKVVSSGDGVEEEAAVKKKKKNVKNYLSEKRSPDQLSTILQGVDCGSYISDIALKA